VQNKLYFPVRDGGFTVFQFQLLNLYPIFNNFYTTSSRCKGKKAHLQSQKNMLIMTSTLILLEQEKHES